MREPICIGKAPRVAITLLRHGVVAVSGLAVILAGPALERTESRVGNLHSRAVGRLGGRRGRRNEGFDRRAHCRRAGKAKVKVKMSVGSCKSSVLVGLSARAAEVKWREGAGDRVKLERAPQEAWLQSSPAPLSTTPLHCSHAHSLARRRRRFKTTVARVASRSHLSTRPCCSTVRSPPCAFCL